MKSDAPKDFEDVAKRLKQWMDEGRGVVVCVDGSDAISNASQPNHSISSRAALALSLALAVDPSWDLTENTIFGGRLNFLVEHLEQEEPHLIFVDEGESIFGQDWTSEAVDAMEGNRHLLVLSMMSIWTLPHRMRNRVDIRLHVGKRPGTAQMFISSVKHSVGSSAEARERSLGSALLARYRRTLDIRVLERSLALLQKTFKDPTGGAELARALNEGLVKLITSEDWDNARDAVTEHPELLETRGQSVLDNLLVLALERRDSHWVRLFGTHRVLLRRCKRIGVDAAFQEADEIEMWSTGELASFEAPILYRFLAAHMEAKQASDDFHQGRDMARLDEALRAWKRIIEDAEFETLDISARALVLDDSAELHFQRYLETAVPADLEKALEGWGTVLKMIEEESPKRPRILVNCGHALWKAYQRSGDEMALRRAIDAWREAVAQGSLVDSAPPWLLNSLAVGLIEGFDLWGDPTDLDAAVDAFQRAVELAEPGTPEYLGYLCNLASAFSKRYGTTSSPQDIDKAVTAMERVVESTPSNSPQLAGNLSNLGVALHRRFQLTQKAEDLDRVISLYSRAVELGAKHPLEMPDFLCNLANALADRYTITGERTELDHAVEMLTGAMDQASQGSPSHTTFVNNLGTLLMDRYGYDGDLADLSEAIRLFRLAVGQTNPKSPSRPHYLKNLGAAMRERFRVTGDAAELEQAIGLLEDAMQKVRPGAPDYPVIANSLAVALHDKFIATGDEDTLRQYKELLHEASKSTEAGFQWRASTNVASSLWQQFRMTGNLVDLNTAIESLQDILKRMPPNGPPRRTLLGNYGSNLWERFIRLGDMADLALAIQVYGEAIDLTPPNSPDLPGMLGNLANALKERSLRAGNWDDLDESVRFYRKAISSAQSSSPEYSLRLNSLAAGLLERHRRTDCQDDLNEAIHLLENVVKRSPETSLWLPIYLGNLGCALSLRYANTAHVEDIERAVESSQRALNLAPPGSPDITGFESNLARCFQERFIRTRRPEDREAAFRTYEKAGSAALEGSPTVALQSATQWCRFAFDERDWPATIRAYALMWDAGERILMKQIFRQGKGIWLTELQGLSALAAYALTEDGQVEEAVLVLERSRARLLTERLELTTPDLDALRSEDPGLFDAYFHCLAELNRLDVASPSTDISFADVDLESLRGLHKALRNLINRIRQVPGLERFLELPVFDDIRHVLTTLEKDSALVYIMTTPAGSLSFIVLQDSTHVVRVEFGDADLRSLLVRESGDDPKGYFIGQLFPRPSLPQELDLILPTLGERVFRPIAERLVKLGIRRIHIVPSGLWSLLPLHAARYSMNGRPRYFTDDFVISYAPNAISLARIDLASIEGEREPFFVGIGNPEVGVEGSLPKAEAEVKVAAEYFPASAKITLLGQDAKKKEVLEAMPRATYLHFACHGSFDTREPLSSSLILADEEALTLREVLHGHAILGRPRLVVLSACQTAITDFASLPDEFIGFPSALIMAGASGVVSTLWPVDDFATALLVTKFYELQFRDVLAEGEKTMQPVEALGRAQAWLRDLTWEKMESFLQIHPQLERWVGPRLDKPPPISRGLASTPLAVGDSQSRPFSQPYFWAAFVFVGR